jgi:S1-C subfamily serine protease
MVPKHRRYIIRKKNKIHYTNIESVKITIMIKTTALLLGIALSLSASGKEAKPSKVSERREVANYLQDISVTIRSQAEYSKSEGSGVLITRSIGDEKVTFVWTCGHVVDNLREVRNIIVEGSPKKVVEFDDVQIIKELVEEGRRVGEIKMDAVVIKYSDADDGEDLAVLMVRARDYGKASAKFYLDKSEPIIPIGSRLFHVGSLLGQMGANSMTSGIISQVGRIHGKVEFDQTTVTAFPGSSGGGVYLQDGRYVGMIVRGAGEGFNLMVPVRRMKRWAEKHDIMWALDPSVKMPSIEEIKDLPIETVSKEKDEEGKKGKKSFPAELKTLPFLIREEKTN